MRAISKAAALGQRLLVSWWCALALSSFHEVGTEHPPPSGIDAVPYLALEEDFGAHAVLTKPVLTPL
eukprot:scaffold175807_cov16-Tisochrysis_lutea.AAC.2